MITIAYSNSDDNEYESVRWKNPEPQIIDSGFFKCIGRAKAKLSTFSAQ